ncbi:MAG: SRPBCC family protein [Anaerolineae bacterium]|nr:SRPBCC family protein [Anaerolineae bacterium]
MSKNNTVINRDELSVTMSREFNAERERVWKVYTDPELIPRWWGPRYLTTTVDKMDLRVGGVWRYIQKDPDGNTFAFNGVYKEIDPPNRLVSTFEFEPMAGHVVTDASTFEDLPGGRTRLTTHSTFSSLEDLDGMVQSGMEGGAIETWDRVEELLAAGQ